LELLDLYSISPVSVLNAETFMALHPAILVLSSCRSNHQDSSLRMLASICGIQPAIHHTSQPKAWAIIELGSKQWRHFRPCSGVFKGLDCRIGPFRSALGLWSSYARRT